MTSIVDAALSRARTVLTIFAVAVFAGLLSYINIPKESDPDIPIPFVLVTVPHPGISPEDGERLLLKPMEKRLQTVEGVKHLNSGAREGMAYLVLEFDVDFDVDQALIDVREQVDIAEADLPDDSEEPQVSELNAALFPVLAVALSGDVPERKLYELARQLQDEIEALPNVLEARLAGNREELLEIIIEPAKLEAYRVTQQELITAVTTNNRLIAAGALDSGQGRFQVKVPGLFETAEDVYSLPIKVSGDGVVTLSDLAEIRRTFKDADGYAHFNGKPSIALEVVKRIGANIIETNQQVRQTVIAKSQNWPENVKYDFTLDLSQVINDMLTQLEAAILTAICLVMIIVVAALGLRSGFMVGLAIPSSFLLAFLNLNLMGSTLNSMVMFGMVISVGILVDAAIVIVEYADRKMSEGQTRDKAYGLAAKRMFWPIVTSTLTTLAAFIPMLAWPGIVGKFMSYLPITMINVLGASMLVALIFLPVIGSLVGRTQVSNAKTLKALASGESGDLKALTGITGAYVRLVQNAIERPLMVIGISVGAVFSIGFLFMASDVGSALFVESDSPNIAVLVGARGNLSSAEVRDLVAEVEDLVKDVDGVGSVFSTTGTIEFSAGPQTPPPDDTIGQINIELLNWKLRRHSDLIVAEIRELVTEIAGIKVEVRLIENGPPVGKAVQLELRSDFGDVLLAEATRVRRYFESLEGLIELDDSRPLPGIEWELKVDREQAGRFGADVSQVGAMVQLVTNGILLSEYRPDDSEDEVEIRVRFPYDQRSINQLDQLRIQTRAGLVPISSFVKREPKPQVNKIERIDGKRVIAVRANTAPGYLTSQKVAEIEKWIEAEGLDKRVTYDFRGADEESDASTDFLGGAMAASLFLMAIILLTQFNSFYYVVLTLSSVVLSTTGVLLGIVLTGQTISIMMTGTGVVALAGIVVNNNIVLIDTYQRLRQAGYELYDAILRTAAQRLRPVLLTTITTICGLLPMALQVNLDFFAREVSAGGPIASWWVPLATAVIFGLSFSTLITLVLTPSLLALPDHLKKFGNKLRHREIGLGVYLKLPNSGPAE